MELKDSYLLIDVLVDFFQNSFFFVWILGQLNSFFQKKDKTFFFLIVKSANRTFMQFSKGFQQNEKTFLQISLCKLKEKLG